MKPPNVTFYCPCGFNGTDLAAIDAHLANRIPEEPDSCCNCGGQRCMGCVTRDWFHECADDCPECCESGHDLRVGRGKNVPKTVLI